MAAKSKTRFTAKKIFLLAAAIILFSAVVSILVTANSGNNRAAYFLRYAMTPRGTVEQGVPQIEGIDPLENIPQGEICYNINKDIFFPNGYLQGDVLLHNPENSAYALQFSVYLADGSSNIPVYTSPVLQPGTFISGDKLNRYLYAGTYPCTYSVSALDPQNTDEQIGSASGFLTVTVMS